jgi:hypothetical protein
MRRLALIVAAAMLTMTLPVATASHLSTGSLTTIGM